MNIKTLLVLPLVLLGASLNAGTLLPIISNFTALTDLTSSGINTNYAAGGTWANSGEMTFASGVLTVGSTTAISSDSFNYASITSSPYVWTAGNRLSYTASVNAGNLSANFVVNLVDSGGTPVLTAVINTSGWLAGTPVSGTALFTPTGSGSTSTLTYFNLTGDGTANAFRMSFDQFSITAIPEPSTYVALFGVATIGLAVWRKRRKVA